MDQRSICIFLAMKGLSFRDIHNELIAVLGPDATAYSTVTKYLRQRHLWALSSDTPDKSPTKIIDDAILDALARQPFSSIRELAKLTCIATSTVYRHLTRWLGFIVKHLRWVRHCSTDTQNASRVTPANRLLHEIRLIERHDWHSIMTLDESWLYFPICHEQIWLRPDEEPPERARHTIQDQKIMVTITWNLLGFPVVDALPKRRIFNEEYYLDNILRALVSFLPEAGEE
jgi:hypothetical protein